MGIRMTQTRPIACTRLDGLFVLGTIEERLIFIIQIFSVLELCL